jgi:hypothetical protein
MGVWEGSKRRTAPLWVPKLQDFIQVCRPRGGHSWDTGFDVINSWRPCYASFTPPTHQEGEFFTSDGLTRTVMFCRFQELQVIKTLICVTSHSIMSAVHAACEFFSI